MYLENAKGSLLNYQVVRGKMLQRQERRYVNITVGIFPQIDLLYFI